jgi:hypothetical protein
MSAPAQVLAGVMYFFIGALLQIQQRAVAIAVKQASNFPSSLDRGGSELIRGNSN